MPQHLKCLDTVIYDLPLITILVSNCHLFSDITISQGSVATPLRCGGIFSDHFTANLSPSLTVKELWKSVKIWQSYRYEFGGPLFWNTVYMLTVGVHCLNSDRPCWNLTNTALVGNGEQRRSRYGLLANDCGLVQFITLFLILYDN